MQLKDAERFLNKRGFQHPVLEVLKPSINDYKTLLFQPKGEIEATNVRIGNRDQPSAANQCLKLLEWATKEQTDLVVTPEYCVPWNALVQAVLNGYLPGNTSLWALGCESITAPELDSLEDKFEGRARVLFEEFDRVEASKKQFLDPLVYIFRTKDNEGTDYVVVLIQFKTHPSVDYQRTEIQNLFCGHNVYVFGTCGQTIRFASFICSDAFAIDFDRLNGILDRTLLLHIQLNPNPRHNSYLLYRKHIFTKANDETELICLNWAGQVLEWEQGQSMPKNWENIGGTAWYLRPDKFDCSDHGVENNHRAGLYYTRLKPARWHALFFNYEPTAFALTASKVWHDSNVSRVQSNRCGPRLKDILRWDAASGQWKSDNGSVDGFAVLLGLWGTSIGWLGTLHASSPVNVERLLALTAGCISNPNDWYDVRELDSFEIDEAEFIKRITFAQDKEPICDSFRRERLKRFATFKGLLDQFTNWPPELSDLSNGHEFEWSISHPHSNISLATGNPATLVYLGEDPLPDDLKRVGDKLRTALLPAGHPDRLCIFYRRNGLAETWRHPDVTRIDKPSDTKVTDITGD